MDSDQAKELLRRTPYCILATASPDGHPWVAPLFFNYDEAYKLVWESARDARHSRQLKQNPRAAIVVADFEAKRGLYFECIAQEVEPERIEKALAVFARGPHRKAEGLERTVADYLDERPFRLYEAVPVASYALIQERSDDGYTIDARVKIDLNETRERDRQER